MAERVKNLEAGGGTKPLPPRLDCVAPDSKKLSAQGTRLAVAMLMFPNSKRGSPAASLVQRSSQRELRAAIAPGPLAKHAIMDGKFESHSNNYDESNLNRPLNQQAFLGGAASRTPRKSGNIGLRHSRRCTRAVE
jgi:hypothetical protein